MHNTDHQNKKLHQKSVLDIVVTARKPSYQNEGKSQQPRNPAGLEINHRYWANERWGFSQSSAARLWRALVAYREGTAR